MKFLSRIFKAIRNFFTKPNRWEGMLYPLTVFRYKKRVVVLCKHEHGGQLSLRLLGSTANRLRFRASPKKVEIRLPNGARENLAHCTRFRISGDGHNYIMTYIRTRGSAQGMVTATSHNLLVWKAHSITSTITEPAMVVPYYLHDDMYALCYGDSDIHIAYSPNGTSWHPEPDPVLTPRPNSFDSDPLSIMSVTTLERGIFMLYDSTHNTEEGTHLELGAALLNKNNPNDVQWRTDQPLWKEHIPEKRARAVGAIVTPKTIYAYWSIEGRGLLTVSVPNPFYVVDDLVDERVRIEKSELNPIMSPIEENGWEAEGVFNPATVKIDGDVHILYRAVGSNGSSMFGYAKSEDGKTISERERFPAYWPRMDFEGVGAPTPGFSHVYGSGGGWGGCEDPKLTRIGDTVYLTYVAMPGHWPTRTAISSIDVDDFLNRRWDKWSIPALMSPPGVDNKSAVLLPERVDGKYVIFHRVWPDIVVDYVNDLNFYSNEKWLNVTPSVPLWRKDGKCVILSGSWPHYDEEVTQHENDYHVVTSPRWEELTKGTKRIPIRPNGWDSHKVSIAAAPIKTEHGWLAIYGAVDRKDFDRYKVGAMLLDLKRPEKVLYRTNSPIIIPEHWYEHDWKPNIVYPSGNEIIDGELHVYYGGGDKHICVATAPLGDFINDLIKTGHPHFTDIHT